MLNLQINHTNQIVKTTDNSKWVIAYDDARYFRDWDMLEEVDGIHFKPAGCELLVDSFIEYQG